MWLDCTMLNDVEPFVEYLNKCGNPPFCQKTHCKIKRDCMKQIPAKQLNMCKHVANTCMFTMGIPF